MTKVLVVDDSATMRAIIIAALQRDPAITVVGQAADPIEARAAIKALNPDVVTLDIEMPGMDGLDFLERIMRLRPTPVVMVSSLTSRGAEATIRALELGAFDCVGKPNSADHTSFAGLAATVRAAAGATIRPWTRPAAAAPAPGPASSFAPDGRVVAIGSSTGGVEALLTILAAFPANCPPTVITQHIKPAFTGSLSRRLDRACAATVAEATDGAPLLPGHVYLAPGDTHLEISGAGPFRCRLRSGEAVNGHRPSVDTLFHSVARHAGRASLGVILTGMGRDGADGLLAIRGAGGRTLGQNAASCVVYGMPRVAFELGAVEKQVRLEQVAGEILALSQVRSKEIV